MVRDFSQPMADLRIERCGKVFSQYANHREIKTRN